MTLSSSERKIRSRLPIIRLMQVYLPLPVARWLIKQGLQRLRLPADVIHETVSAGGVPCEWLIPPGSPRDRVLLYLHGGGFVFGQTPQHLEMVAYLVKKMRTRSLLVDYRLGPEHPFPAALDDCLIAYRWLQKQGFTAQHIVLAGDSAGGNLAITAMMKLRDNGEQLPAAAACLSPVANLSSSGKPATEFNDPLIDPRAGKIYHTSYVANHDPRDPLISPVFGDWHGLPPLLVHAGEDEFLHYDALRIQELAKAAGVDVRLEIYPHMWHVWQIFLALPQATQSLDDIAQFLKSHSPLS
jgi:epsilon-lactone hydrolase